jgi:hypothetical protein
MTVKWIALYDFNFGVDLPVPRSPMIMTPPILGSITFNISASFISSCPTIALKGNTGRFVGAVKRLLVEGAVKRLVVKIRRRRYL